MQHNPIEKEILIVKNITREGPGLLEDIIKEHGIKYTVVDLSQEQKKQYLENCGAVIILGGPDSANDGNPKMKNELALIRNILEANVPYLGICLGLQTFVKAAGGQVVKCQTKEVGFRDQNGTYFTVELTEEGQRDAIFRNIDHSFNVFHLHGETVILTENMKLLAVGKFCRNQIVKIGSNAYGFQCHFELTKKLFEIWIKKDTDLQKLDKEELLSDFLAIKDKYAEVGRQLFQNFLKIAGYLTKPPSHS
jgi:GMP synthase (glutamine-hydrolysing)